ncbi:hypothetical protein [Neogemmobacter tilapiae]|uniref:Uncharacterized protein n=1 Tax=Neogemmobacter tilapiae TaxID=875041 RepID=A0A918TN93_9RHOB|nr:hypothetical protein [Gemmobacter tilapiae]GHC55348.1 hypothetical protein GCM10007315_17820 [Gemmobacter tilapiae]
MVFELKVLTRGIFLKNSFSDSNLIVYFEPNPERYVIAPGQEIWFRVTFNSREGTIYSDSDFMIEHHSWGIKVFPPKSADFDLVDVVAIDVDTRMSVEVAPPQSGDPDF